MSVRATSTDGRWRRALVTGASSGIGEAFARDLAGRGTALVLVARRADRLAALADGLRATGVEVEVLPADLASPAGREAVAERLRSDDDPIDLLVNNAGLGAATMFHAGDPGRYREILDVNIAAVVELSHAAIGRMVGRGGGTIVNVSSLGGLAPGPGFAVYSASKAFVCSFGESLHEEYRRRGIVVTTVCPGATHTDFGATAGAGDPDLPEALWQTPEQVVAEALSAAGRGRSRRITGWPNRIAGVATSFLPGPLSRRIAASVTDQLGP